MMSTSDVAKKALETKLAEEAKGWHGLDRLVLITGTPKGVNLTAGLSVGLGPLLAAILPPLGWSVSEGILAFPETLSQVITTACAFEGGDQTVLMALYYELSLKRQQLGGTLLWGNINPLRRSYNGVPYSVVGRKDFGTSGGAERIANHLVAYAIGEDGALDRNQLW